MRKYNIPNAWLADIATCGCFSDRTSRNRLWFDWTDEQKESALRGYDKVLEKAEKYCKLREEHAQFFGDTSSVWCNFFDSVFCIDLSNPLSPSQMLYFIEEKIKFEEKSFKEEIEEIYMDAYCEGSWMG